MAKQEFAIIYIVFAIVLLASTTQVWKHKDEKSFMMKELFSTAMVTVVIYICSLFTNDFYVIAVINTLVFVAEGWLLYIFLNLAITFAQENEAIKKKVSVLVRILLAIDSVQMILGVWFGFSVRYIEKWINGNLYLTLDLAGGFVFHLCICYAMAVGTCIILIRKAYRVSAPYVSAYLGIVVGLVALVVVNACFLYENWLLDFSILLYAVVAILLEGYMYHFMRFVVRRHMKNYVVDNLDNPILFFDLNNSLQIYNAPTEELLDIYIGMELERFIEQQKIDMVLSEKHTRSGEHNFGMVKQIGNRIYLMQGKKLADGQGRFVGTLFAYYDITREERMKDEATYNATHDKLTGLWNREFFFEMCRKMLQEYPDTRFIMLVTDIDHFNMFNVILGKRIGDTLLASIAKACDENSSPRRLYGRIAADRFALLMPKNEFSEERYLEIQNSIFVDQGFSLTIKNYNGICEITDPSVDPETIYDWAYMALSTIKGDIKKDFAYFDDQMRKSMIDEALTVDELMNAIKEHQFVMYLQPQVNAATGEIVGAEALARWKSPKRGMVSPALFIPIFEENGMITNLDYYIWEEACKKLRQWKNEGKEERSISINISSKDFYLSDLYESVTGLVSKYGIDPSRLKLEITETAIVLDVEEQMALVKKFQDYGFLIEMDDFGSGYSSLNSLKNISVDILKLDMKFFGNAVDENRSHVIIQCMIDMAKNLEMPVVAEGVETKEQVDFLHSVGCDIIQGFYFAKPMPIEEFEQYASDKPYRDISTYIS